MGGFEYPIRPQSAPPTQVNRISQISPLQDPIPLTGRVQGKQASDLEERFARALEKSRLAFTFQYQAGIYGGIPGQEKRVDFMVYSGLRCPVEIDGVIAHSTAAQQARDTIREILLNDTFRRRGILPIRRVKWWQLETQRMADQLVQEMFGGRR